MQQGLPNPWHEKALTRRQRPAPSSPASSSKAGPARARLRGMARGRGSNLHCTWAGGLGNAEHV
eukprot:11013350-Lingulodinium_polyedra.AAC.1